MQPTPRVVHESSALPDSDDRYRDLHEREQLGLVVAQIGRLPLILLVIDAFTAWLVWRAGFPIAAALWLTTTGAFNLWRYRYCANAHRAPQVSSGPALRLMSRAFVAAAFLRVAPIPMVFLGSPFEMPVMYTMVCAGLAAGGVATAGGVAWAYSAWALMVGGSLCLAWVLRGSADDIGIAVLVAILFATLDHYAREQGRTLRKLVELACDNALLATSLRAERDRAESASLSKTRFFAAASHDLRQPLHALSINATTLELVSRRQPESLIAVLSSSISRALRQSNELLDALLDISQLDAGVVEMEFAAVDACALLNRLGDHYQPSAAESGLTLEVSAPAGLPALNTDARQLYRVLANLVSNALKFTVTGGVVIAAEHIDTHRVRLSVIDSGPGIPLGEQGRVFEDFYQLGNSGRDRSRGLGLGLSIVRRTAALLGAELRLESAEGKGCRVDLVVRSSTDVPDRPPDADLQRPLNLRVLAVDDEVEILDSLAVLLPHYGCEVRCAVDAKGALDQLDDGFLPHLLLVDHRLRNGTGTDVIAALRARIGPIPAVIVTGDTAPATVATIGARTLVVHKPLDGELLTKAMRDAMAGASTSGDTPT